MPSVTAKTDGIAERKGRTINEECRRAVGLVTPSVCNHIVMGL